MNFSIFRVPERDCVTLRARNRKDERHLGCSHAIKHTNTATWHKPTAVEHKHGPRVAQNLGQKPHVSPWCQESARLARISTHPRKFIPGAKNRIINAAQCSYGQNPLISRAFREFEKIDFLGPFWACHPAMWRLRRGGIAQAVGYFATSESFAH